MCMNRQKSAGLSRRDLLKGMTGLGAVAAWSGCSPLAEKGQSKKGASADLIRGENQHPGTPEWLLSRTRIERGTKYRSPAIEGFCSRTSLRAGEALDLFVDIPELKA